MNFLARIKSESLLAALVAVGVLVQGCQSNTKNPSENQDQVVAALTAQADGWDKAIVRKDRQAIEQNMADDFRQIDGQGNIETKKSFVDGLLDAELELHPYTVEEFEVRLYGDVALLSGKTHMTGAYQGKSFSSHYRYIDIYVRRAGEWKIVSVQISKLPNP